MTPSSEVSAALSPGKAPVFLYVAWLVSLLSLLGSLFFSEVVKLPPCSMCWYQRICLYPMVLLLPVGIVTKDRRIAAYTLPLALVGVGFGLYHNLLYYGIIAKEIVPCTGTVSCSSQYLQVFGFIDIPLMSLVALLVVVGSIFLHHKTQGRIQS